MSEEPTHKCSTPLARTCINNALIRTNEPSEQLVFGGKSLRNTRSPHHGGINKDFIMLCLYHTSMPPYI